MHDNFVHPHQPSQSPPPPPHDQHPSRFFVYLFRSMDTRQPTSLIHAARRMEWKRKDEKKSFSSFVYPSISPCGRYVACAGDWNGCFHIWDVRSARSDPMQVQQYVFMNVYHVSHTCYVFLKAGVVRVVNHVHDDSLLHSCLTFLFFFATPCFGFGSGAQSVLVNSVARVVHTAWHPGQDARALMSLSAASGQSGKNFALHLHGGLRP